MTSSYIGAIDQGTTGTKFVVFNLSGAVVSRSYREHKQIYPESGWVEHDPEEIWQNTLHTFEEALQKQDLSSDEISSVGITNQRETIVFWNDQTGNPARNAIVWQDRRTEEFIDSLKNKHGKNHFRQKTGLPLAAYFSASKIKWVFENDPEIRRLNENGTLRIGTMDSWLIWKLTGGSNGGNHVTDVTNASRTMLMNLKSLEWDEDLLNFFDIPKRVLPEIRPSSDRSTYGKISDTLPIGSSIPICGAIGDQQAALVGQGCFEPGDGKNTYGTGNFLLVNTGQEPQFSEAGLLTTPAYQFDDQPPSYALEGSIAITGALVQWLRDHLEFFDQSEEVEPLAQEVSDNGGVYFVPAFSGLYAPYWKPETTGLITGLTRDNTKAHIARAALESTAYQTRDVLEAMEQDTQTTFKELRVDGGMVQNDLLMQFQSDLLQIPVKQSWVPETTTALGAAFSAAFAIGELEPEQVRKNWDPQNRWTPAMEESRADQLQNEWRKAVRRCIYSPPDS